VRNRGGIAIRPSYQRALFLFRRDLRLIDNLGLNRARQCAARVLPLFVLDPAQLDPHAYRSDPALAFMGTALEQLAQALQGLGGGLWLARGDPEAVLARLLAEQRIEAVFVNRDFTPFSRARDARLAQLCQRRGCAWHSVDDLLLQPPEQGLKADGQPYRVFTPFYRHAARLPVALPQPLAPGGWLQPPATRVEAGHAPLTGLRGYRAEAALWLGGRLEAETRLGALSLLGDYASRRDLPAEQGSSHLAAHLKFGTCSVREVHERIRTGLGEEHPLLRQLYWRDFFSHIAWHYPAVFGRCFDPRFEGLVWRNDTDQFDAWCRGRTGFPLIDAGMRELNASGYMHNRVRMLVASFLVKDLQIDWRWGERYFARRLIDYDPCVNNGNWQWAASTGCDAQPWFRIFNPWLQQRKFDPAADYIRRWIPELTGLDGTAIHRLERDRPPAGYPAPIVDHRQQGAIAKQRYRDALALAGSRPAHGRTAAG